MAELNDLLFGVWTLVGQRKHKFNCIRQVVQILAPSDKYDWTKHLLWRCGLMSNYFDRLLWPPYL